MKFSLLKHKLHFFIFKFDNKSKQNCVTALLVFLCRKMRMNENDKLYRKKKAKYEATDYIFRMNTGNKLLKCKVQVYIYF